MLMTLRLTFVLLVLMAAATVRGGESPVIIEPGVAGKRSLPAAGKPRQAVLLLHGWNGSMDEVGNLYADLAEALQARGIASLRFDFSGEGERVGFVVTSTLDSRISESKAAFEHLREKVPDASYGVVGFSLGGLTAMMVAGEEPSWFKSMVLWSAAQEMRMAGDAGYNRAVRQAITEGRGTFTSYAEITLTREFLLSFLGVNARARLAAYPGALLAIRGDNDFLATYDPEWLQLVPTREKAFLMIGGADHIFNVLDKPRPAYGERVIEATADWLARTLD